MYTECELETILKEHYRKEREQNGVKDTNVTNTLKSLKGEVLSRLEPRESKGIKLNTHSVGQQWPQLRASWLTWLRELKSLRRQLHIRTSGSKF